MKPSSLAQIRPYRCATAHGAGRRGALVVRSSSRPIPPSTGAISSCTPPEAVRETGAHRFDTKLTYQGRGWATLRVEVSPPEGKAHESESVPALSVSEFGLTRR
jgi:hypothetical protein